MSILSGLSMEAPLPQSVPRGVSPEILLTQVRNTAPFLFQNVPLSHGVRTSYVETLRAELGSPGRPLSHSEYFRLCLSAHWATVGTFVPTDVDSQIRFKLWHPSLGTPEMLEMAEVVLEAYHWPFEALSQRWVRSSVSGKVVAGHQGEWFSVAVAAYSALRRRAPEKALEVRILIESEVAREAQVYAELKRAKDGIGLLKTACMIAHNLGDLDRVVDAWNLPLEDPLRESCYKLGHLENRGDVRFGGLLYEAGELNKQLTAVENHRHFALREPRCLRRSEDFLIPIGPFFDEWGMRLARHPLLRHEDIGEISHALVGGWERLEKTVGYARALAGIQETFPGGLNALCQYVPAKIARTLKSGPLRALTSVSRKRFEDQWAQMALRFLKV